MFFSGYSIYALSPWSAVWWSLDTEVQFYALLPVLGLLRFPAARRVVAVLAASCAAAYVVFATSWTPPAISSQAHALISHSLFGMASVFGFGILAAWIHGRWGTTLRAWMQRSRIARSGGCDAALVVVIVALGLLLQAVSWRGLGFAENGPWHFWHVLEGFLWASVVVLLVMLAPLRAKKLLCNGAFERLGGACVAPSSLTYRFIERPFLVRKAALAT